MNLRGGVFAALLIERQVVIGVGIKRRVEINEAYQLAGKVVPQHLLVVGKIKCVYPVHKLHSIRKAGP